MTKLRASELYLLPERPVKTTLATVHKLKIACAIAFLLWMGLTTALGQTRTFTSLLSFDGSDGSFPQMSLVQGTDGNFYGTTSASGSNGEGGTIFEITPKGELTTLYSFCAKTNCNDGATPYAVLQAGYGRLYGTTYSGGEHNFGTIFEITLAGKLTILHSFDGADGSTPYTAALIRGSNGDFYGTTFGGGVGGSNGDGGTVFKINQRGKVTTLYSFCIQTGCVDGRGPVGGLMQATNGNFYGTTIYGGINGTSECGSYGTWGCGTLFALDIGLRPFVKTIPASGKIGARVIVLGNDLTEASSVTFNGTEATFKALSDSVLTAIVPAGATTGEVEVTLPNGILKSNSVFQVSMK